MSPSLLLTREKTKMKFWNLIFLLGLLAYVVIRGIFEQRVKGTATALSRSDGRERALLLLMFIGGLLLPLLYLFSDWLKFADYRLPVFVPWCGVAAMLTALWLFWRSHVDLGRNWSRTLEIRQEHQLVTHGVYGSIRHPMYAAIWLFSFAQGLLLENWLAGWAAFVAFGVMYFVRVPREERMMRERFGTAYRGYQQRTGRIFPPARQGKSSSR